MKALFWISGLLLLSTSASATTIHAIASSLGGTTWQFDYTLTNDTLGIDIQEFTIYFDHTLYANLQTTADEPPGWDSIVIQPDPGIPDDGFFDSLALGAGIAPGESVAGFSVIFDYLGPGAPGAQVWEIVDPNNFGVPLDQGGTAVVPLPAAFWLLLSGLFATLATRRR